MIRNQILTTLLLASAAIATGVRCNAAGPLAIQGAKIIPIASDPIEVGSILIEDGQIVAFGQDIEIPGEAKVIDGEGMVVMPGFIDAHNASGMSQANEQNSVVPFLSVVDSIDPISSYFEECRRNGVTTAAVVPGNSTLIGGKAAIVKTAGQYVDDMIVRRDSALKLSLLPTSGSRMSQMAKLRKELDKAKKALEKEKEESEKSDEEDKKDADKSESGKSDSSDDDKKDGEEKKDEDADKEDEKPASSSTPESEGLAALKLALEGKIPVYMYCQEAMDVAAALKIVDEYGLDPIFVLGQACYKAAGILKEQDRSVLLDPTLVFWERNPRTREDKKIVLPKIYQDAGVSFVFQVTNSSSRRNLGSSYLWYQAATAVKYGVSEADALEAMTLAPAKLIGIDDLVGSIEVGKNADLVILTGEPLDIGTWVAHTIVDGEIVYNRDDDEKLERLLSPVAE